MRKALFALLTLPAALMLALAPLSQAQAKWPEKPVRIILPFGPGGVADVTSRMLAAKLTDKLGQQVVIENMPSPGGINAARAVIERRPTATPWPTSLTAPPSAWRRSINCRSIR